ncbi:SURF1 family protein [Paraglaciecola sp. 2405UD69-4]|uniref:SURF1 family protein n=1 Tax=Paraglaciecola sp. 2405UD69-4 TaxID=3391836 RepID=UPI0039C9B5D4
MAVNSTKSHFSMVASLVTFTAVVIMFALGVWQLQRAQQKTERLLSIQQGQSEEQMTITALLDKSFDDILDMPVSIVGEAMRTKYFLIDNKIHKGRVGYHVLVPVYTNSAWVLANFGWVAAMESRGHLPLVNLSADSREYSGVVAIPNKNPMVKETAVFDGQWPKVLQQIDIEIMAQHFDHDFLPLVVLLNAEPDSGFERHWQAVVMPPEKHIAYAVQWFLLAIAAIAVFVLAQRKKQLRSRHE